MSVAGRNFVDAYDRWQTLYAYHRLRGWDPLFSAPPPELALAYNKFLAAIDALSVEELGRPRPNYTELAKALP